MPELPYKYVQYSVTAPGEPTFQDWLSQLTPLEQNFVLEKIQDLRAGDWLNVVTLRDNLYELRIQMRETLFLYFAVDAEKQILQIIKGVKVPTKTQSLY